jgi:hypothetical protein
LNQKIKKQEPDPEPNESFEPITMRLPKQKTIIPTPKLEALLEKDYPKEDYSIISLEKSAENNKFIFKCNI